MTEVRFLDPRHGTHEPTTGTPPRRPGSVRRTTTVDAVRSRDVGSGLVLRGRARDLATAADGSHAVVAEAETEVTLSYTGGAAVESVETTPAVDGIGALVGKVATTGFRAVIDDATAAEPGSLVYLLLDEIPVSTLVSGYSVMHASSRGDLDADAVGREALAKMRPPGPPIHGVDACAGFRTGSVIITSQAQGLPAVVTGPDATAVVDPDDSMSWHALPGPLGPDAMRRWRRNDLWSVDGVLHVDSFFRDSHMAPDGQETIIHEYTVTATIDAETMVVTSCAAVPRVLPWVECPEAAASAGRLVGMHATGLRHQVRAELVGPSTCTHLRDQLREIEDAVALARLLPGS